MSTNTIQTIKVDKKESYRMLYDSIFPDTILNTANRFVSRLFPSPTNLQAAIFLSIFILLFDIIGSQLIDAKINWKFLPLKALISLSVSLAIYGLSINYSHFSKTVIPQLVDSISNEKDYIFLEKWLTSISNKKRNFAAAIFLMLIGVLIIIGGMGYESGNFDIRFVPIYETMCVTFIGGLIVYYFIHMLRISWVISRMELDLFLPNPSKSTVIEVFTENHSNFGFFTAACLGILNLVVRGLGIDDLITWLAILFLAWGLLFTLFANNQIAIRKMVTRAKRKLIIRIEKRLSSVDLLDLENYEETHKLIELHEITQNSPNSSLDLYGILELLSKWLSLPFIGFLASLLQRAITL